VSKQGKLFHGKLLRYVISDVITPYITPLF